MKLLSVEVTNYRNIRKANIVFAGGSNVFRGKNAQGKTNLLEAVNVLASGRSYKGCSDKELVMFGEKSSILCAEVDNESIKDRIRVCIYKDKSKEIYVNGIAAERLGDLYGKLYTVTFSPHDLVIVKEGPSNRRIFLDTELCRLNKVYYHNLKKYYYILKQRSLILKQARLKDTLDVWDSQLVLYGKEVIRARCLFIDELRHIAADIYRDISNQTEELSIEYKPCVTEECFAEKLRKNIERDLALCKTETGPHKDDIVFCVNEVNTRIFGSQGQQRSVCLALKLAVVEYIKRYKKISPVLLLDDVFSELDDYRQNYLYECIKDTQAFITATDTYHINSKLKPEKVFYVENGCISE